MDPDVSHLWYGHLRDYLIAEFKEADIPVQDSLKIVGGILGSHQMQMITEIRRTDKESEIKEKNLIPRLNLKKKT